MKLEIRHYNELKRFFNILKELHNQDNLYETKFTNDDYIASYVLTVSYDDNIGYVLNTIESKDVINTLIENDLITIIDDPDYATNTIRYYLIKNYDYLFNAISDLISELKSIG